MKKNNWLIEQAKAIERQKKALEQATKNNVPEIYACLCKVLMDKHGVDAEGVATIFCETQELWNELVEKNEAADMVSWCEETTGVSLRGEEV